MYWTTLAMALRWAEYFFLILCIFGFFLYFRSTPHLKFSSFSPSFYLCFGSPIFLFYYIQFSSLPPLLSFLPEVFLSPSFSTLDSFSRSHTISCAFSFIFRKHPFWPYRNMFQCGLVGTGWGWRWTKKKWLHHIAFRKQLYSWSVVKTASGDKFCGTFLKALRPQTAISQSRSPVSLNLYRGMMSVKLDL